MITLSSSVMRIKYTVKHIAQWQEGYSNSALPLPHPLHYLLFFHPDAPTLPTQFIIRVKRSPAQVFVKFLEMYRKEYHSTKWLFTHLSSSPPPPLLPSPLPPPSSSSSSSSSSPSPSPSSPSLEWLCLLWYFCLWITEGFMPLFRAGESSFILALHFCKVSRNNHFETSSRCLLDRL